MEPYFENHNIMTEDRIREFVRATGSKFAKYFNLAFSIIALVAGVLLMIFPNERGGPLIILICFLCGITGLFSFFTTERRTVKRTYNDQHKATGGSDLETIAKFYDRRINVSNSINSSGKDVAYISITKFVVSDSFCLLLTKDGGGIVIAKDGFGDKTYDEFWEFIRDKSPDAKCATVKA